MATSDITTKRCSKCGNEYPATREHFYKNSKSPDGLKARCKKCCSDYSPLRVVPPGQRIWGVCKQVKPATREYFTANRAGKDGLQSFCKECGAEYQKHYRSQFPDRVKRSEQRRDKESRKKQNHDAYWLDPEKYRKRAREYAQKHIHRVRAAAARIRANRRNAQGEWTNKDLNRQFKIQNGNCWWCGCKLKKDNFEVDHRVPLSKGGTNYPNNIVVACKPCNRSKQAKLAHERNGRLL